MQIMDDYQLEDYQLSEEQKKQVDQDLEEINSLVNEFKDYNPEDDQRFLEDNPDLEEKFKLSSPREVYELRKTVEAPLDRNNLDNKLLVALGEKPISQPGNEGRYYDTSVSKGEAFDKGRDQLGADLAAWQEKHFPKEGQNG